MWVDLQYLELLSDIMKHGSPVRSRNALTKRQIALQARFVLTPLISVRTTAWKNALREMEWFLSGSTNINDLHEKVRHWWTPWAGKDGEIKNHYGKQLRSFENGRGPFDQVSHLITSLKENPFSRRNVATTWNAADMADPSTSLANCHGTAIQCYVDFGRNLDLLMFQRSADMICGVPHNWVQYWALLIYLAFESDLIPRSFTWVGGDCHIYEDHFDLANKLVTLSDSVVSTSQNGYVTPELMYHGEKGSPFKADNFTLATTYKPMTSDKAKMVV